MAESENMSAEQIDEVDKFDKEDIEDVEGKITDFFMGLFGRRKKDKPVVDEDEDNNNIVDEEDDFVEEESWDGNPFVKDSKLYGQDYDKLKVCKCIQLTIKNYSYIEQVSRSWGAVQGQKVSSEGQLLVLHQPSAAPGVEAAS